MSKIETGLVSITFRKLLPKEIVDLTNEADLDGIEWGGDIHAPPGDLEKAAEIRQLTVSAGLKVLAYGSYYRTEPSNHPERDFAPVLDTASELGAPLIRVWAGKLGSRDLTPEGRQALVSQSRKIADMAREREIVLASEYHGGTATDTPESAEKFIEEVNHPNYRTLWQPHVGAPFDSALQSLRDILPHVENVHVFHWWPTPADRHPLEEGQSRWIGYFEALKSSGRDHACLLEFVKGDHPGQFLEDAKVLKKALGQA